MNDRLNGKVTFATGARRTPIVRAGSVFKRSCTPPTAATRTELAQHILALSTDEHREEIA